MWLLRISYNCLGRFCKHLFYRSHSLDRHDEIDGGVVLPGPSAEELPAFGAVVVKDPQEPAVDRQASKAFALRISWVEKIFRGDESIFQQCQ